MIENFERFFKLLKTIVFLFLGFLFLEDILTWKFIYNLSFNSFLSNFIFKFTSFDNVFMILGVIIVLFIIGSTIYVEAFFIINLCDKNNLLCERKNNKVIIFSFLLSMFITNAFIYFILMYNLGKVFNFIVIFFIFMSIFFLVMTFMIKYLNIEYFSLLLLVYFFVVNIYLYKFFLILLFFIYGIIFLIYYQILEYVCFMQTNRNKNESINKKQYYFLYFFIIFFISFYFNYDNKVKQKDFSVNLFFNNLFISTAPFPNKIVIPEYWKNYIQSKKICGIEKFDKKDLNLSKIPYLPITSNEKLFFYKINKTHILIILIEEITPNYQINFASKNIINKYIENHTVIYRILDIGCIK